MHSQIRVCQEWLFMWTGGSADFRNIRVDDIFVDESCCDFQTVLTRSAPRLRGSVSILCHLAGQPDLSGLT